MTMSMLWQSMCSVGRPVPHPDCGVSRVCSEKLRGEPAKWVCYRPSGPDGRFRGPGPLGGGRQRDVIPAGFETRDRAAADLLRRLHIRHLCIAAFRAAKAVRGGAAQAILGRLILTEHDKAGIGVGGLKHFAGFDNGSGALVAAHAIAPQRTQTGKCRGQSPTATRLRRGW